MADSKYLIIENPVRPKHREIKKFLQDAGVDKSAIDFVIGESKNTFINGKNIKNNNVDFEAPAGYLVYEIDLNIVDVDDIKIDLEKQKYSNYHYVTTEQAKIVIAELGVEV